MQMLGLRFDIEGVYFCCFRQPTSTSVIITYPIPPFTTIRGLLECALGFSRDSYYLQDRLKVGIALLETPQRVTELSRILKLVTRQEERTYLSRFPSGPMFRTFLVHPCYRIYLAGEDKLIREVEEKLLNPERPCFLGQSDDMVDVYNIFPGEIHEGRSAAISSVVEGVHEGCEVIQVPYKFVNDGKEVEMKVISVPKKVPLSLREDVDCWTFDTGCVCLF